jgi:hypothetical protein
MSYTYYYDVYWLYLTNSSQVDCQSMHRGRFRLGLRYEPNMSLVLVLPRPSHSYPRSHGRPQGEIQLLQLIQLSVLPQQFLNCRPGSTRALRERKYRN